MISLLIAFYRLILKFYSQPVDCEMQLNIELLFNIEILNIEVKSRQFYLI